MLVPVGAVAARPRRPTSPSPAWVAVADELQVHARVVGGTPGDVLTVTAVAGTTSRELSTANNTGQASVT